MKVKGKVVFTKTEGRKDPWVTHKVDNDYFLFFQITEIDGVPITTTRSAFDALHGNFPKISANGVQLNELFGNSTLPPGAEDVCHLTLANFPDFRENRDVGNPINQNKLELARSLAETELEFELPAGAFEIVSTTDDNDCFGALHDGSACLVVQAPTVGYGRDAVLNLKPSEAMQQKLADLSKRAFGSDFELWNARKQPVPYHITIAQANLNQALLEAKNQSAARPSFR